MLIGITTFSNETNEFERVSRRYIQCVVEAGGIPILLPHFRDKERTEELFFHLDGLILTGGGDIDPAIYGDDALFEETKDISRKRDMFEMQLVRMAHENNLPLLGICRGMQVMNVALGGTLYQDVNVCGLTKNNHFQEKPFDHTIQPVIIKKGTFLASILGDHNGDYFVNSIHHQSLKDVAACLEACAYSTDGIVEGIEDTKKKFFLGVQWHPEFLESDFALFKAFCTTAAQFSK